MPSAQQFVVSVVVLACASVPRVSASDFLRMRTQEEMQATLELVERTLLSELAMDPERLQEYEQELKPLFQVLPKNEHGTLDPAAVRYALHRHFVSKNYWYVKGLEPLGQSWNSSAPTDILNFRVASYVQSLFQERLHGQGMGLHDLAVFAATLSDYVHNEAVSDVVDLFGAFGMSTTIEVSESDAADVIKGYALQILDGNATITSRANLQRLERSMIQDYPSWNDFKMWVADVRQTLVVDRSRRNFKVNSITLESIIEEVKELGDRLGAFQDIECRHLKATLVDIEYKGTGRVLLSDFYRAGFQKDVLFVESVDFLRKLGALDESDSSHPSIIIPNYLISPANCLAATGFHSICCMDECQSLMSHVEQSIAAPSASAHQIAEVVAHLRSDSVDAPRNLSAALVSRLEEIQNHHEGKVPLHGRLFEQWMHHVYPLECSYPHISGTTKPQTPDEWMEDTGAWEISAPLIERNDYISRAKDLPARSDDIAWSPVEELVVSHREPVTTKVSSLPRKIAGLLAILAVAGPLAKAAASLILVSKSPSNKDHFV